MKEKDRCFALYGLNGNDEPRCSILLKEAFIGYLKEGSCCSWACPFYKPKDKEKRIIRGLSKVEKARLLNDV